MPLPQVYVDFNAIEDDKALATLPLTGYGTIASLSNQKIRLTEGMSLLLYEPNNIEVEGVVYFDHLRNDPAGRSGEWVAQFDAREIRDSVLNEPIPNEHFCFDCRMNLNNHLKTVGQQYTELCPSCGASIMSPMEAPEMQPNPSFKRDS